MIRSNKLSIVVHAASDLKEDINELHHPKKALQSHKEGHTNLQLKDYFCHRGLQYTDKVLKCLCFFNNAFPYFILRRSGSLVEYLTRD